ncbi:hypothetical protein A6B43_07655 [Vespertiliibacter pulmonis]|nr:hypothetical protein A6B43_07655 [Vespertiliibacter pulmonis]
MYIDKRRAVNSLWRISEFNLLFLCLLGGFAGTFLIMKYARHKTLHWQFHFAVILSALIWEVGILFCLFY